MSSVWWRRCVPLFRCDGHPPQRRGHRPFRHRWFSALLAGRPACLLPLSSSGAGSLPLLQDGGIPFLHGFVPEETKLQPPIRSPAYCLLGTMTPTWSMTSPTPCALLCGGRFQTYASTVHIDQHRPTTSHMEPPHLRQVAWEHTGQLRNGRHLHQRWPTAHAHRQNAGKAAIATAVSCLDNSPKLTGTTFYFFVRNKDDQTLVLPEQDKACWKIQCTLPDYQFGSHCCDGAVTLPKTNTPTTHFASK
jgi:hypothetical protein